MNEEIRQYLRRTYPNMNQKEIAKHIGFSPEYFGVNRPIGLKTACLLARATGRPLTDFLNK
jgi:hypothetical protein